MPKNNQVLFILCITLLMILTKTNQCKRGQIKLKQGCIDCKNLQGSIGDFDPENIEENSCLCSEQYFWSPIHLRCIPLQSTKKNKISSNSLYNKNQTINQQFNSSRLLAVSCNNSQGFTLIDSNCVNCRTMPFTKGIADQYSCLCSQTFRNYNGKCYCFYARYIDGTQRTCIACSVLGLSSLNNCLSCKGPTFVYSVYGCVNCLTLANNGGNTSCCAKGYRLDYYVVNCVCDKYQGYAIGQNGFCTPCANGDNNCKNCVNQFMYNDFQCVHVSQIPNYNVSGLSCNTGFTLKRELNNKRIISCACSKALKLYQSGSSCLPCASKLPTGVTLASCQSCSASSGFFNGAVQCVYCPSIPFSTKTVSDNGCDCTPNYYWNGDTNQCQCDFTLGLIGGAVANCLNCLSIAFTSQKTGKSNSCYCLQGHKWNSQTNTCDCDFSSPSVFSNQGVCVNCASQLGSSGAVGSDRASCVCITSYVWNYGLNKCQCDSSQNFAIYDGQCKDCMQNSLTIGLAYNQQCVCQNDYIWDSKLGCVCPAGYAIKGSKCVHCSSLTLPNDVTVNDCVICNPLKGFALQSGLCVLCSEQISVANSTVINGSCTCPIGLIWKSQLGGCVCNWGVFYQTNLNKNGGFTCVPATHFWLGGSNVGKGACGWSFLFLNRDHNICTDTRTDPNGVVSSSGSFQCNDGYLWSQETFPFKCIPGGAAGRYYANVVSGVPTFKLCTSLSGSSNQQSCTFCDYNQGYLLIPNKNICLYCPSITGAGSGPGSATVNSCNCSSGYWNPLKYICDSSAVCKLGVVYNPITQKCDICDPIRSILVDGVCISCEADVNSNGYAETPTKCGCKKSFVWQSSNGGSCKAPCDSSNSILVGQTCYKCPTTNGGTGAPSGTGCGCINGFTWQVSVTGGSCICNKQKNTILNNGTCVPCPNNANTTGKANPRGGCVCNSQFIWDANKTGSCICDSTVSGYITKSGNCFQCLSSINSKFDGTVTNGKCNCKNNYTFVPKNSGGDCVCASPSVLLPSGICLTCPNNANATGDVVVSSSSCLCYNKFIWDPINTKNCICDSTVFGFITPTGICFQCLPEFDPNFDKTITNGVCNCKNGFIFTANQQNGTCTCNLPNVVVNGTCLPCPINANTTGKVDSNGRCQCKNNYIWNSTLRTCICDDIVQAYISSSSLCFQCSTKIDIIFDGTILNGGCRCRNGFTFVNNTNGTGGSCSCLPKDSSFVLPNGFCLSCPEDSNTVGDPDKKGGCLCRNGMVWNTIKLICECNQNSIQLSNGTCFVCGLSGTFTTSTPVNSNCKCNVSTLTWSKAQGICDCGPNSALVITNNNIKCIPCTGSVNSVGKADSFSCKCINTTSAALRWNKRTNRCDCGLKSVFVGSICIPCSANIYANGLNINNPEACSCLISAMTWNKTLNSCTCGLQQVIFEIQDKLSCVACNLKINAKNKSSPVACNCFPQFVWVPNVGCVCINQGAIAYVNGSTADCITCTSQTFSSGQSQDKSSCICLGNLAWNSKSKSCGCNSSSALGMINGQYTCFLCSAATFSKTPLVNLTTCGCMDASLVWYSQGYCGCPNRQRQAVVIIKSKITCVNCDYSIFSSGKSSPASNLCTCVSQKLTFNNGICDCGTSSALILQGESNFKCVNCNNPNTFIQKKISTTNCSCSSTALAWDLIEGQCLCANSSQVIVGSGKSAKCKPCTGQYNLDRSPTSFTQCTCLGQGLIFYPSASTAGACACPISSVMLTNFTCTLCPNSNNLNTPYQCTCGNGYFWDGFQNVCRLCSTVSNAMTTGGTSLACKCINGFVWDVMTLTCIQGCQQNSTECMNCTYILWSEGEATTLDSSSAKILTGASKVEALINGTYTNYNAIKKYQCPCVAGFVWDPIRLRCFDRNLI